MAIELAAFRSRALALFSCIFLAAFLQSCSFTPGSDPQFPCDAYEGIKLTPLSSQSNQTVFENSGTIIAIQGTASAVRTSGDGSPIKVQQTLQLPTYADQAVIFLNGWKLDYHGDDHHILALGNAITEIHMDIKGHSLTWDALGLLRDNDGKAYDWTYQYTVVAWNTVNLNLVADQGAFTSQPPDCSTNNQLPDNYFYSSNSGTSTALSCFFSFLQNSNFASSKTVAILPRGFGFVWNDEDHNLFQIGYNMEHSETIVQGRQYNKLGSQVQAPLPNAPNGHVDTGFVSWNPYTIFEDNDNRRDYTFFELVSGMGGNDVSVIQPPYSILPDNADAPWLGIFSSCGEVTGQSTNTNTYTIENIPYQYAVPMLTGWELEYLCSDKHVKDIGVWIDSWSYQPPANGVGGVLTYKISSILVDNDSTHTHSSNYKVTVLGLGGASNGAGGTTTTKGRPIEVGHGPVKHR